MGQHDRGARHAHGAVLQGGGSPAGGELLGGGGGRRWGGDGGGSGRGCGGHLQANFEGEAVAEDELDGGLAERDGDLVELQVARTEARGGRGAGGFLRRRELAVVDLDLHLYKGKRTGWRNCC